MNHRAATAIYLATMIALIVGLDIAVLRHHLWLRLGVNIGIVVVFVIGYFLIIRRIR